MPVDLNKMESPKGGKLRLEILYLGQSWIGAAMRQTRRGTARKN
jgi:hypothetical protein